MNKSGVANTITSVQKDSMVAEPRIIEVGRVKEGKHQQDNVQHEDGICRCICTGHHASTPHLLKTLVSEPQIIKRGNYSPSGHNACTIVDGEGISPTVMENHGTVTAVIEPQVLTPKRTEFGKAIRKKYEAHEVDMSRHDMTTMEPRTDGITNTLTSVQKDNYLAIPEATTKGYAEAYEGDSANLAVPNSTTRRGRVGNQIANTLDTGCQQGVVENVPINQYPDGTARTIKAQYQQTSRANFTRQDGLGATGVQTGFRIRKLTPRECFRLMGVDDADIDKLLSAGISNSQLYKCAGNSIVVDTLYYIMRKMFIDTTNENQQQTLF